jgi:hypothetical protein
LNFFDDLLVVLQRVKDEYEVDGMNDELKQFLIELGILSDFTLLNEGIDLCENCIEQLEANNKAGLYSAYADFLGKAEAYDKALKMYDMAIFCAPVLSQRAYSNYEMLAAYPKKSKPRLERAFPDASHAKAKLLARLERFDEAHEAYEKAVFTSGFQEYEILDDYRSFLDKTGHKEKALLMELRNLYWNNKAGCESVSESGLLKWIRKVYKNTIDCIYSKLEDLKEPVDPFVSLMRGEILFYLDDFENAIPFLTKAENDSPDGIYLRATDLKLIALNSFKDREEEYELGRVKYVEDYEKLKKSRKIVE